MHDAMAARLPKASDAGNVASLGERGKGRVSTSVGVGEEVLGVARKTVSAQSVQRRAQLAQQLDAARVALCVNVAVDVVGVDNRTDPLELVDHLVDATREQCQLDVVDEQRRGFVNERSRVLATQVDGVSMA